MGIYTEDVVVVRVCHENCLFAVESGSSIHAALLKSSAGVTAGQLVEHPRSSRRYRSEPEQIAEV